MRPQPLLRATRPMAVGALGFATIATGTSAVALAQNTQNTQDAITVKKARTHVLAGRAVRVQGTLHPAHRGDVVVLQARRGGHWRTLTRDATDAGGRYRLRYRTKRPGSWKVRVRVAGARVASAGRATAAKARQRRSLGRLNVYRHAYASWYGPGFFGHHLACGGNLTPGTLGVAHKTMPCGTKLTIRYRGRSVRVPVVDRGPYVAGREFDLTSATKQRLGFAGYGYVLVTR
jgi:rare lipoprotein A